MGGDIGSASFAASEAGARAVTIVATGGRPLRARVACAVVVANWRDGELAFVQRPTAIVMAISRTGSASMAASARSERDVAARRRQIVPRPVRTPYGGGVEKWRLREVLWDDGLAVF
jgi:hypothetical protein